MQVAVMTLVVGALFAGWMAGEARAQQAGGERPALFLGNDSLPPMNFLQHGKETGIVVDLARALVKRMRRPVEIRLMDWAEAQKLVLDGRADALLQINPNPERMKIYDFSEPLVTSEFTIFTSAERLGISSMDDLHGLKVGVEKQGLPISLLQEDSRIAVEIIPNFIQGFRMLSTGALDAVIADRWVGSYVLAENRIRGIRLIEVPIRRSRSAIAVRKGNADLLRDINSALAEIRRDGTYDRIVSSWRSKEVVFETREQGRQQMLLLAAIAAALILALAGLALLAREIRRRKRVEVTLRESEHKLRLFIEHAPAAIAMFDRSMRYMAVSRRWLTDYRLSDQDIIGRSHYEIFPEIPERWRKVHQKCLAGAIEKSEEDPFTRMDGQVDWVRWQVLPWYEHDGDIGGIIISTEDITERKRAEEALRKSEERLLRFYESGIVGVIYWNMNGEILDANDKFLQMVGYTREDLTAGRIDWVNMTPTEYRHPDENSLLELKATGVNKTPFEKEFIRKDATRVPVIVAGAMLDEERFNGVGFVLDITERKRAEEALRESEERFRLLFENMTEGVALHEMIRDDTGKAVDYRVLDVNSAYVRQIGIPRERAVRALAGELYGTGTPPYITEYEEVVASGKPLFFETYFPPMKKHFSISAIRTKPNRFATVFLDITERKRVEEEARTTLQRFYAVLSSMYTALLLVTDESRVEFANQAFCDCFDLRDSPADLAGLTSSDIFAKIREAYLNPDEAIARILEIVDRGQPVKGEEVPMANGHELLRDFIPVRINGRSYGRLWHHVDITDRKWAEEALQESEARFRLALRNAPVSVAAQDCDLRYVWAYNQRTMRPEEIIGKLDSDIFTPEEAAHVIAIKQRVLKESIELREQMWLSRPTGRIFLDVCWEPIRDNSGRVIGVGSATVDLTPMKSAEEALRKAHDELEQRVEERTAEVKRQAELLNHAYDAIIVRDADGKILFWNTGAEETYGWSKEEVLGRMTHDLLKTEPAPWLEERMDAVYREGRWEGELVHTGKHGNRVTVLSRWTLRQGEGGKPPEILEINRDISARKRAEEQLRQAQKLEAIGTLAGGIAHDFNNILAGIIGFTEMTLDDDIPPDSPARHHLELVLKGGFRGRDLVKQILAYSRKAEHERKPLSVSPLMKETAAMLRASIPSTIQIDAGATTTSDTIVANATEVQQIIMNLSTNAAYAMRERGGKLTIALSDAHIEPGHQTGLPPGAYVRLTVQDTGFGMAPEVMKRIFDPFFTTKKVGEGTGMGLAVAYGIVKTLGGDITVESMPGMGSTFRVLIPKVKTDVNTEVVRAAEIPGGKERILFVDDEEMLVEWGKGTLERLGYQVTGLTGSTEALRAFSIDPSLFDLVITDHAMPQMAGSQLSKELLRIRHDIPIILCTGHSDSINPEKANEIGIREFLMKPMAKQELAAAVRRVLDEKVEGPD
jgi:PAS domain S-box-containing protein